MNEEQYNLRMREIEDARTTAQKELFKEYALSNNTVKVGDVVTDHIGSVKVEQIGTYKGMYFPCCTYYGLEIKKDGTPTKKMTKRTVYQSNLIK